MDTILQSKRKILLVGEGNFSFSRTLKQKLPQDAEVVTTCYEDDLVLSKMEGALENVATLKQLGATVMVGVDATRLHQQPLLSRECFDCIVFQFPHVGGKGNIKKNRSLLKQFFISASKILSCDGSILVTLCNGQGGTPADVPQRDWCNSWQIVAMATYGDLILTQTMPFEPDTYTVYHSTGYRSQDKSFNTSNAVIHLFNKSHHLPSCPVARRALFMKILNTQREMFNRVSTELSDLVARKLSMTDRDLQMEGMLNSPAIHHCSWSISDSAFPAPSLESDNDIPHHESLVSFLHGQHHQQIQCCISSCVSGIRSASTLPVTRIHLIHRQCPISPHWNPIMHYSVMVFPQASSKDGEDSLQDFRTATFQALCKEITLQQVDKEAISVSSGILTCTHCNTENIACSSLGNFEVPISISFIQTDELLAVAVCLDQLVMNKLGLDNIKLLWSCDTRWWSQLSQLEVPTVPYSLHPPSYVHDLSFWESLERNFDEEEFYELVRETAGDHLREVSLLETFLLNVRKSRCYRMIYQSCDQPLTKEHAGELQDRVRECIQMKLDLTPR